MPEMDVVVESDESVAASVGDFNASCGVSFACVVGVVGMWVLVMCAIERLGGLIAVSKMTRRGL